MKKQSGFSIIEYMVSMVILLAVFAIVFQVFIPIARSAKGESNNIQTQIEGILGLELLRRDVVHAGVGLPWVIPAGTAYTETTVVPENAYNDGLGAGVDGLPPRAIIPVNGDSGTTPPVGVVNSDYLVTKSTTVADIIQPGGAGTPYINNPTVDRWTTLYQGGQVRVWGSAERDLIDTDQVIVVQPTSTSGNFLLGVDGTGAFTTPFGTAGANLTTFAPTAANQIYYVFGINGDSATDGVVNMPFNRADYYISLANVPSRCAANTGVLVKKVLNQDGTFADPLPLLDCVADFQIAVGVDNLVNNISQRNCLTNPTDAHMSSASLFPTTQPPNAAQVRAAFREVRLYVLAQEGAQDLSYNFTTFIPASDPIAPPSTTSVRVGEANTSDCDPGGTSSCNCTGSDTLLGEDFDFSASGITNYQQYRWRVYRLVIKPEGLVDAGAQ